MRAGARDPGRAGRRLRRLFRAGVFLNAGDAIERLAEVDTVVFDKTGTLTLPEPRVDNAATVDPDLLQRRRGSRCRAGIRSPPRSRAQARKRVPFEGAIEEPGQGVRAMIDGVEARLGSPAFCGDAGSRRPGRPAPRPSRSAMASRSC